MRANHRPDHGARQAARIGKKGCTRTQARAQPGAYRRISEPRRRAMGEDDVELVGLYWTLSGPVEVHFGREWSLFDLGDRCAEAEKVGFKGIGIWHADLEH